GWTSDDWAASGLRDEGSCVRNRTVMVARGRIARRSIRGGEQSNGGGFSVLWCERRGAGANGAGQCCAWDRGRGKASACALRPRRGRVGMGQRRWCQRRLGAGERTATNRRVVRGRSGDVCRVQWGVESAVVMWYSGAE